MSDDADIVTKIINEYGINILVWLYSAITSVLLAIAAVFFKRQLLRVDQLELENAAMKESQHALKEDFTYKLSSLHEKQNECLAKVSNTDARLDHFEDRFQEAMKRLEKAGDRTYEAIEKLSDKVDRIAQSK